MFNIGQRVFNLKSNKFWIECATNNPITQEGVFVGPGDGAGCVVGGATPPPLCAALSATIKATILGAV